MKLVKEGRKPRVAVIGAGVTGLTTAFLLARAGIPVEVFEAADGEGGLAGTHERDGFRFDFGPHELCTDNAQLQELLRDLCGDDLLELTKRTAQHLGGRFVRYPFGVADVLRSLGARRCARSLLEAAGARLVGGAGHGREPSFASWTRARFGHSLYEAYFGPYAEKVWGVDPTELDAAVARDRIAADSLFRLAWRTLRRGRSRAPRTTHTETHDRFYYPRGGAGALPRALRARLAALGVPMWFGRQLVALPCESDRIERLRFADGTVASGFSHVVSTIPLTATIQCALGDQGRALLARNPLAFRALAFVFVGVAQPSVTGRHWVYFPDPRVPFQRLTEFGHFGAEMAPAGCTGLALEVAMTPGDAQWSLDDQVIAERCLDALAELELLPRHQVRFADVVRKRHAYPLQTKTFQQRVDRLLGALAGLRNLVPLGRQGLFRYCNQDECMEMALEVVPRLAAGADYVRYTRACQWRGVGLAEASG